MKVKAKFLFDLLMGALIALPMAGLSSCNLVREDLAECPAPQLELRFVYDYNMEFANAFHNQVDCLSVLFYNSDGQLIAYHIVDDPQTLADEDWRMRLELPAGDYHIVAYGGMECSNASFIHVKKPREGSLRTDLHVQLDYNALYNAERLHNHFYGALDLSVDPEIDTKATVKMMRNTNYIQVALQHTNGNPINCDDFIFEITDDNNDFDADNNLLATGEITYSPWETLNASVGEGDNGQEWHSALSRFTVSRLVKNKPAACRLNVYRRANNEVVFSIPLINYMLMFKHDNTDLRLDNIMSDQEYLDRENRWNFVFFLKDNVWLSTYIIVNDWEVRLNSTDF